MYFCSNCGKEYPNQVSFCAACGNPVVAAPAPAPVQAAPVVSPVITPEAKEPFLPILFSFIGKVLQILSGMFAGVSIAEAYLDLDFSSGYYSGYYVYGYFEPDEAFATLALVAAIFAVMVSVLAFVFALIKKADTKTKFSRIAGMVLSMALFVVGCVLISNS